MRVLASRHSRIDNARHYLDAAHDDPGLESLGRGPRAAIFVALALSLGVGAAPVHGVEGSINSSPSMSGGSTEDSRDR